jgi:DNA-binding GntR family transcriptional regulator
MAKIMSELLWKLGEDTANEISEPEPRDELDAWLDEQAELTAAYYAKDLARAVHLLEQELSQHGLSPKTH